MSKRTKTPTFLLELPLHVSMQQAKHLRAHCEAFCKRHGTHRMVINGKSFSPEVELVSDFLAIVTVFSARLYGLRSHTVAIRAAALGEKVKDDQGTQDPLESHA